MSGELIDDPRLAVLMIREALRRARRQLRAPVLVPFLHRRQHAGDRLLGVPRDLERGRSEIAEAIYGGVFELAGTVVECAGASPFALRRAPLAWREALFSFEWLRHLAEVEDALASANARALVGDFLSVKPGRHAEPAARPDIVARRLVAFLAHSPLVLQGSDAAFRRRFLDALSRDARLLRRIAPEVADGLPRLLVRIALAFASLSLPGGAREIRPAGAALTDELDRQIFADGGHVSRNPQAMLVILKFLLPLRQLYAQRSQAVPRGLLNAVDRMLPTLRFFLHGDGALALFNGAGTVPLSLVGALLRQDETLGEPMEHLRQSGYRRLSQGATVIIQDVGTAPAPSLSGEAAAGTLAFEFSSGRQRFVVNCGAPARSEGELRRLSRTTAAHSTLTVADRSSSRFARSARLDRFLGGPLVSGPSRVPSSREETADGPRLFSAHDGYRQLFSITHEREITLGRDGFAVEGTDRLHHTAGARQSAPLPAPSTLIRFHLHPDVLAEQTGRGVRLAAGGEVWWFFTDQVARLEDSIFLADRAGARQTRQIVVEFADGASEANWRFERQH